MTKSSDRKIAANRENAKKSTGPQSESGQRRSRRNARRHGLAIDVGSDPSFRADIEMLAKVVSSSWEGHDVEELSREGATAEIDLLRIRKIRAALFNTLFEGKQEIGLHEHTALNKSLSKLERYERRAFSRRNRALRAISQVG
jgi:hypothetical protein